MCTLKSGAFSSILDTERFGKVLLGKRRRMRFRKVEAVLRIRMQLLIRP